MVRDRHVRASITAGMAAVFTALADTAIKPGGRLSLVLPRAVLTGIAWQETRKLLAEKYRLEYLVCSHAPKQWNFSENTNLSEVLLVARKLREGESTFGRVTTCVNLWQQPRSAVEALSLARCVAGHVPDLETQETALEANVGGRKLGEVVSIPWEDLKSCHAWELPCAFAQSDLTRALFHLQRGTLYLPGEGVCGELPLCPLGRFADLGPDPRDIADGFAKSGGRTSYPALLDHDASVITTMQCQSNRYLTPLSAALKGRKLRKHTALWPKAGRVQIVQRVRLNTKRLLAVRLPQKALANIWWPTVLKCDPVRMEKAEKALVLWLNSTFAFLLLLGCREETEGAWVQFKKPTLGRLPVLDILGLDVEDLSALAAAYDRLALSEFDYLPAVAIDPTRVEVDTAIAAVLGIPSPVTLRELLGREPILSQTISTLIPAGTPQTVAPKRRRARRNTGR
ncbi:MAG: hypothetical protein HYS12_06400 [Planctomycetes bacterium]|nr:hypothetical protein [Planctomycetota bacterium]